MKSEPIVRVERLSGGVGTGSIELMPMLTNIGLPLFNNPTLGKKTFATNYEIVRHSDPCGIFHGPSHMAPLIALEEKLRACHS